MNFQLHFLQYAEFNTIFTKKSSVIMAKATNELINHLKAGNVYRRADIAQWSSAVDRHLSELVNSGFMQKLSAGLYYVPKKGVFGIVPPDDGQLVKAFLKDEDFLLLSYNVYNSLGVGTTQLYNTPIVYNHKRHGQFDLGGKKFIFHAKHRFPKKATPEFLLVDLVNNLESLAEDKTAILKNVQVKAVNMDAKRLRQAALNFGNTRAKALFASMGL